MRRIFAGLMALILSASIFTACRVKSVSLEARGAEVIALMAEMVKSEEYLSQYAFGLGQEAKDTVEEMRETDYSDYTAVYEITASEWKIPGVNINKDKLSETLYEYASSSYVTSFASSINLKSGTDKIVLSSTFTASLTFGGADLDSNKLYIYTFEGGYPIAVAFVKGKDGSFRASGNFIFSDDFVCDSEESIESFCKQFGITDIAVKKK